MKNELKQWINPIYLEDYGLLKKRFIDTKPFEHFVLNNFFNGDKLNRVYSALLNEQFYKFDSDLYSFMQTDDLKNSENEVINEFYNFFRSPDFVGYISKVNDIKLSKVIDMSGFIYGSGDYLLPHDDKLEGRKVAYVLNLSTGFTMNHGGSLDLFDAKDGHPTKVIKSILPGFNTFTMFKVVPGCFHRVSEVVASKKRFSIAGWFHG